MNDPNPSPEPDSRANRPWLSDRVVVPMLCVLLVLVIGLIYGQTAGFDFINYDDGTDVYQNRLVKGALTPQSLAAVFTEGSVQSTTPLTYISHMLVWHLLGHTPAFHHLTNVVLHAAAALVLLLVLWRMTNQPWPSALAAAIFAVHPLRVESVAWVAERKDVLSGLMFALTLAAYSAYARRPASLSRYLVVLVCFVFGLAAKPMAVTLPFLLLLLDYWPLGRMDIAKPGEPARFHVPVGLVLEKIPLLLITVAFCLFSVHGRTAAQLSANQKYSIVWRIGNAAISYAQYLSQFVFPANLAPVYPRRSLLPPWQLAAAALLLVAITALALRWRKQRPYLLIGWLWYLGMMVPAIGLVQFGVQAEADRFTYLPQIGLAIALAWGIAETGGSCPRLKTACFASASCGLAILAIAAWRQTSYWRDNQTLWPYTLARTSRNAVAHNQYGTYLAGLGRIDDAVDHLKKSVAADPDYAPSYNNLGGVLANRGQIDEAISHFRKALEIDPLFAEAHSGLGRVLARSGKTDEAVKCFQQALRFKPDMATAHSGLGSALSALGRTEEAERHLKEALAIDADSAEAHNNFGAMLMQNGRVEEAASEFRLAVKLDPNSAEFHCNLGLALRDLDRLDDAAAEFRKAIEVKPDFGEAHGNLGGILFLQNRLEEALVHFQKHVEQDPTGDMARRNFALAVSRLRGPPEALVHWQWWIDFLPNDGDLLNDAAWQLATSPNESLRNGKDAVQLALKAMESKGNRDPMLLRTLAAAYAETGRYDEAVKTARRAAIFAGRQKEAALQTSLKNLLTLFEARKPYRETANSN